MIEVFYLFIYVFSLLLIGVATLVTGETYGEAINVHLDRFTLCILLILYLLTYVLTYWIYRRTQNNFIHIRVPKFKINKKRIHIFFFCCLIISAIGTMIFGVGKLEAVVTTNFGFLFNLIKFSEFFPIYYVVARDEKKKLYWINIVLFCLIRTIQGWSGWIMTVAVLELFFQEKKHGLIGKLFRLFKAKIMSLAAIVFGGLTYYYISPLKNAIRYNISMKWFRLTFFESFTALVERFCNFAVYTSAWQNVRGMTLMYNMQGIELAEFKSIFIPLVPSVLMPNKNIRSMGNIVQQAMWPTLENGTSTGYGFWMYWYTLFRCDFVDFIVTFITFIVGCLLTFSILKSFDNEDHDCRILYFMFLVSIANGTGVSQLFGYGYLASIYLIVPMVLFGVIKIVHTKMSFERR